MTNGEKFKTAKERMKGWREFCRTHYDPSGKRCAECPLWESGAEECRFPWLELEYKKPPREMEAIIKELRDLSSIVPMPRAFVIDDCVHTIQGKPVRGYLGDLADEIEAAWNRREK